MTPDSSAENPTSHEKEEVVLEEQKDVLRDEEPVTTMSPESREMSPPTHLTCRTVQPNRVLCGVRQK